jgi:hypothetical protein
MASVGRAGAAPMFCGGIAISNGKDFAPILRMCLCGTIEKMFVRFQDRRALLHRKVPNRSRVSRVLQEGFSQFSRKMR